MSDIGLLMTGMFATGQQYKPNLTEQQLSFQHENSFLEATSTRLIKPTSVVQAAPPEFTHMGGAFSPTIIPKLNFKKILSDLANKTRRKDFSGIGKASLPQLKSINQVANLGISQPQIFADAGSREITDSKRFPRFLSPSLPMLQFGNSGISVRVLQKLLAANGYAVGVDGFFGALTESAIKSFQHKRNLVADGIVGTKTWSELTK
jgi:hypothetical protein